MSVVESSELGRDAQTVALAEHLATSVNLLLPPELCLCRRGSTLLLERKDAAATGAEPAVTDVEIAGFLDPDGPPPAAERAAGVGTRALDALQDAVAEETRQPWPRDGATMLVPAVRVDGHTVVLGFARDRHGTPDPSWSLPPWTVPA